MVKNINIMTDVTKTMFEYGLDYEVTFRSYDDKSVQTKVSVIDLVTNEIVDSSEGGSVEEALLTSLVKAVSKYNSVKKNKFI